MPRYLHLWFGPRDLGPRPQTSRATPFVEPGNLGKCSGFRVCSCVRGRSGCCVCFSRVCADTVGSTHRWRSGPALRALLAVVVDAEHLTTSAILAPPPRGAALGAKSYCARRTAAPSMPCEPSPHPVRVLTKRHRPNRPPAGAPAPLC